jgi:tRNA(Ile)-lysidine synthase
VTAPTDPIGDDELDGLFARLDGLRRIGVAVSGGPDSTALLVLLDRWNRHRATPAELHVLTVDHGLRTESAAECQRVVQFAAGLGRSASVLSWSHDGAPPEVDLQAAARDARYQLLADAAGRQGLDAIVLGHTLDDKAETLLLRLGRGSGVAGLAAMADERVVHAVRFIRPLLAVPKTRLTATLEAAGIGWTQDPSNAAADRFSRARVRALMPQLATIGLTVHRLAATADRLARAAAAIEHMVAEVAADGLVDHGGVVSIDVAAWLAAPDEVALRLLAIAHGRVRPARYPPRAAVLEAFLADARSDGHGVRRRTTGGVVLDAVRDRLWVYAEAGRGGFPVLVIDRPGTSVWDGRFEVAVTGPLPRPLTVAAAHGPDARSDLPQRAAETLPLVRFANDDDAGAVDPNLVHLSQVTQL